MSWGPDAGGWHLRRKPRVLLLLRLLSVLLNHDVPCQFCQFFEEFIFKRCGRMRSCCLHNVVFHTLCYLPVLSLTVLDCLIGIHLGSAQKWLRLGAQDETLLPCSHCTVPRSRNSSTWIWWERLSRTSWIRHVVLRHVVQTRLDLETFLLVASAHLQWKPFRIPIGDSFQKAFLEEWKHTSDDSSRTLEEQCVANIRTTVHDAEYKVCTTIQRRPQEANTFGTEIVMASKWRTLYACLENLEPRVRHPSWERAEAPLPPLRPRCNFIHPKQFNPFPERLEFRFQVKRCCLASKIFSPRAQTSSLRGWKQTLMLP